MVPLYSAKIGLRHGGSVSWLWLPLMALVALIVRSARAEDPAEAPPLPRNWTVTADCQMVAVPQKVMLPLVAEFGDDAKAEPAWDRLQKLIESGEATLLAELVAKGVQGQNLVSEAVEETRYAVEFEPPQLPVDMALENAAEALKAWPIVGVTPTKFETRNVGAMLDLKVKVSADGRWLDADATLQHVRFLKWQKTDAGRLADGSHLSVEQPFFHSMKNTSNLRLRNGEKALVGVHKVPGAENTFELFVVHVTATQAGPEK